MSNQMTILDFGIQESYIPLSITLAKTQEKIYKIHKNQQGLFKRIEELRIECEVAEEVIHDIIQKGFYE